MDISPDNILFIRQGKKERLFLIDYNSAHSLSEWKNGLCKFSSIKENYTAPEVRTGYARQIGFASDLYSVAAVFYAALFGKPWSVVDQVSGRAPMSEGCALLADVPEPVGAMVARILKKGLQAVPARRYQHVKQMRADFEELMDRISCIGVTHWAIWEKERVRLEGMIRKNPSMRFLKDEAELFPICLSDGEQRMDLQDFRRALMARDRRPVVVEAKGGMGKTTALQALALRQNEEYDARRPVALYLRAADYRAGESWFIHDSVLRSLRFGSHTKDYETARHELNRLFSQPLAGKGGAPAFILLLDGFNEIACDAKPLLRELQELALLPGIALVIASRGAVMLEGARTLALSPLAAADVERILSDHGLLMPEDARVRELLATPLSLSMFLQAARNSQEQVRFSDMDSLMRTYLDAILAKETAQLEGDERFFVEAAVRYVLPAAAEAIEARGGSVEETELMAVVSGCYGTLKARGMKRIFPQWAGGQSAILAKGQTPEAWYAEAVRETLWRRMGLLVQDDRGRFRVYHQLAGAWLAEAYRPIRASVRRYRARRSLAACGAAMACMALLFFGWSRLIRAHPYDAQLAEALLLNAEQAYMVGGQQYNVLTALLDAVDENGEMEEALQAAATQLSYSALLYQGLRETAPEDVYALVETGDFMPWSRLPVNVEAYVALIELPEARWTSYTAYIEELTEVWRERQAEPEAEGRYLACLRTMLDDQARVLGAYYKMIVLEERRAAGEGEPITKSALASFGAQGEITSRLDQPLDDYLRQAEASQAALEEMEESRRQEEAR